MRRAPEILIAERNPRIREFLRREIAAFGYHVHLAENEKELLELVRRGLQVDLLVLDPDFPSADPRTMVRKIVARIPQLPVVLHCIRGSDDLDSGWVTKNLVRIEKQGDSAEVLRKTIREILSGASARPSEGQRSD